MQTDMTRKHFIALAAVISRIEKLDERRELAEKTAKDCKKQNPRFDHERFLKACGLSSE